MTSLSFGSVATMSTANNQKNALLYKRSPINSRWGIVIQKYFEKELTSVLDSNSNNDDNNSKMMPQQNPPNETTPSSYLKGSHCIRCGHEFRN
jgi:hypothetical protein